MKVLRKTSGAAFVAASLIASSASAQGLDWRVTPYIWGTAIEGDLGLGPVRRDVDLEFSDILNVLSGALLMHVEGQKDEHKSCDNREARDRRLCVIEGPQVERFDPGHCGWKSRHLGRAYYSVARTTKSTIRTLPARWN